MFYHDRSAEQYTDDAKMHHFLDTNLFRAKPPVSVEKLKRQAIVCYQQNILFFT